MSDLPPPDRLERLEKLAHWWREPLAGIVAVGIGTWDTWHYGRDGGLSTNLDELLVIGGVVLIAGSRKLFIGANGGGNGKPPEESKP